MKYTKAHSLTIIQTMIEYIKRNPQAKQIEIAKELGLSRQIVNKHYVDCYLIAKGKKTVGQANNIYLSKHTNISEYIKQYPMKSAGEICQATGVSIMFYQYNYAPIIQENKNYFQGKTYHTRKIKSMCKFVIEFCPPNMAKEELEAISKQHKESGIPWKNDEILCVFDKEKKEWIVTVF